MSISQFSPMSSDGGGGSSGSIGSEGVVDSSIGGEGGLWYNSSVRTVVVSVTEVAVALQDCLAVGCWEHSSELDTAEGFTGC